MPRSKKKAPASDNLTRELVRYLGTLRAKEESALADLEAKTGHNTGSCRELVSRYMAVYEAKARQLTDSEIDLILEGWVGHNGQ